MITIQLKIDELITYCVFFKIGQNMYSTVNVYTEMCVGICLKCSFLYCTCSGWTFYLPDLSEFGGVMATDFLTFPM